MTLAAAVVQRSRKTRSGKANMRIYWIRAQAPRRVLALVKHLEVDVECVDMDLMGGLLTTPDYAAVNPNMKTPTLVDGDRAIADFQLVTDWPQSERPFDTFPNIVRWLDGLGRIPAWSDPWPATQAFS
jgi:glutathione S-transferase